MLPDAFHGLKTRIDDHIQSLPHSERASLKTAAMAIATVRLARKRASLVFVRLQRSDGRKDWSKKFGVSPEELKKAVSAVGTNAEDVKRHLAR